MQFMPFAALKGYYERVREQEEISCADETEREQSHEDEYREET